MSYYPVEKIHQALPRVPAHRPLIVAVDGGSGSGKSTLADEWAARMPAIRRVSLDDFHLPVPDGQLDLRSPTQNFENAFDRARIRVQLLGPLRAGRTARFQKLDGVTGGLGKWETLEPSGVVVLEGVYSHRQEWAPFLDFRVWIEMPKDLRRKRMEERGANSESQMNCWQATEEWYVARFQPMEKADLVVDGVTGLLVRGA